MLGRDGCTYITFSLRQLPPYGESVGRPFEKQKFFSLKNFCVMGKDSAI